MEFLELEPDVIVDGAGRDEERRGGCCRCPWSQPAA